MLVLDHLAVVCSDLGAGMAWVESQLGVSLVPGGKHDRFGTHNVLLGLGEGIYLEVIAKDPAAADRKGPCWFGLDDFTGAPRLGNWICRTDDLDGALALAPASVGPPLALSRGDLAWQITVPEDGSLPYQGAYPTLIRWADGTRHPSARLPESGCRLAALHITHPAADMLRGKMDLPDPRVRLRPGAFALSAVIDTPGGSRVLS